MCLLEASALLQFTKHNLKHTCLSGFKAFSLPYFPSPPKLMWQKKWKIMNGCAFIWAEAQLLLSCHVVPTETSPFVTREIKGWLSLTAHCSLRGFVFPSRVEQGAKGLTWAAVGKPGAPPPVAVHQECRELPAWHCSAGGEAGACPAPRQWSHTSAVFISARGKVS